MENFDSESYWNRSSSKAFSFDDDDDGGENLASGGNLATVGSCSNILNDDTISEASFDNSATTGALNLSIKSVITEEALKVLLQEQTLDDRIVLKGVAPEEELKLLRRQIQTTLYNPSAEVTAYKLLMGKNVPLEVFKSLHEKEELLDAVMLNGAGDGIIGVLLFLRKTLNREKFYKILKQRPKAVEHYISYLRQRQQTTEAIEVLQHFGRHQDVALMQFKAAFASDDIRMRKQKLQHLCEKYNNEMGLAAVYQQQFHATFKLLQLIEKERNSLDNLIDLNSTPLEVLYACCRKNSNWKDQDMIRNTSPHRLCAEQQISSAQFEWVALNERAAAQAYADLENIFERVPTWHPMKQKQFHISFNLESAITRLYARHAPTSVLYLFLTKMPNTSEKLDLAKRVKCIKAEIDALVGMKDVAQLTQLHDSLPDRSEEQFYCEKALKGLQTKRWTTDSIKLKL